MPLKILLITFNARHYQSSLALPYIKGCLDRYATEHDCQIMERAIQDSDEEVLWDIAENAPDIIGFSCYLWNIEKTMHIAGAIKAFLPNTKIVVGGPEVGFTPAEALMLYPSFDVVVKDEGEETWVDLIQGIAQQASLQSIKGIAYREGHCIRETPDRPPIQDLDWIPSPFTGGLIGKRLPFVYYETSRGCPFHCAFCVSSATQGVRTFSMERVRQDLTWLCEQNYPSVRIIDRTFNLPQDRAAEILEFLILHSGDTSWQLEITADCLSEKVIEVFKKAPPGRFKLEIGLQSAHEDVLGAIDRRGEPQKTLAITRRLADETKVALHIDLIAGLPGENYERFLESLDAVFDSHANMIQVGILKLLPGTRIRQEAENLGIRALPNPPYVILETPELSWREIKRIHTIDGLVESFHNANRGARLLETASEHLKIPMGKLQGVLAQQWTLPSSGVEPQKLYDELYRIMRTLGVPEPPLLDAMALDYFGRERAWDKQPEALRTSNRIQPYQHHIDGHRLRRHCVLLALETGNWLFYLENSRPHSLSLTPEEYRWLNEGQGAQEVLQGLVQRGAFV